MSDKLTTKQINFCYLYVELGNATAAAKQAGYSEKTSYSIGQENLTKPDIQEFIKKLTDEKFEEQKRKFSNLATQALNALQDVVINGRGMAKVTAANSILDRAGHKPTEHIRADINSKVDATITLTDARSSLLAKLACDDAQAQAQEGDS